MALRYEALITGSSPCVSFRRLSEPSVSSSRSKDMINEGYRKYNSLPQYSRLHGFLQSLSSRRNRREKEKIKKHNKQDREITDNENVLASNSNELELVLSQSERKKNRGNGYRYRKLKFNGYHRTMSDNTLLNSKN